MPNPLNDDSTGDLDSLKPRKEKKLQPLGSINSPNIVGADEELLAELRARTAKLAEQVRGKEDPAKKILRLDNDTSDEDIVDALKKDSEKPKNKQDEREVKGANPAVELIRKKLAGIYKSEPNAADEAIESFEAGKKRSKHQLFMYELTTSGKSLADIQTDWHNYYIGLPEHEKHEVWSEFYESQKESATSYYHTQTKNIHHTPRPHHSGPSPYLRHFETPKSQNTRTVQDIKSDLYNKVKTRKKLSAGQHLKSLMFGLSMAALVGLIITFTFFNEVFIAPFISPSRNVSATPIIGNLSGDVGSEPKIIIPKINLEVPVVFDLQTTGEKEIQHALEDGVVHYANTPYPGEQGNIVIVGHSSNNILNSGKYKFAFVLLKRLEAEDTFYVQKDGIRYTYKVYKKEVVKPDNVDVLNVQDRQNTITLITCDPPGTSINRLIIVAEQISPDPAGNTASTSTAVDTSQIEELPSNAPSLWSRVWPF